MLRTAHGTELLLLHQSISFSFNEWVLRIALALKNEVIVKNLTPAKLSSSSRWPGSGARTVLTILPDYRLHHVMMSGVFLIRLVTVSLWHYFVGKLVRKSRPHCLGAPTGVSAKIA
jgi:hypothetical protein